MVAASAGAGAGPEARAGATVVPRRVPAAGVDLRLRRLSGPENWDLIVRDTTVDADNSARSLSETHHGETRESGERKI